MEFRTFLPARLPFRLAALALALALAQGPLAGSPSAQQAADTGAAAATETPSPGAAGGPVTPPPAPAPVSPPPPPPPPQPQPLAVYIAVNGTTTGPFDRAELQAKVASGELTDASMVWQAGMAEWQPAGEVAEVAEVIAAATAPDEAVAQPEPEPAAQPEPAAEPKPVPGWGPKAAPVEDTAEQPEESPEQPPTTTDDATTPQPQPDDTVAPAGFDPAAFVLGAWQSDAAELPVPDLGTTGTFSGTTTYQPDGTMRLEGVLRVMVNGVPMSISMAGRGGYAVVVASEGESFTITPDLQMTLTVPGYPPQTETMTDPATYVVLDQNTMRDTEGVTWRRR